MRRMLRIKSMNSKTNTGNEETNDIIVVFYILKRVVGHFT